MANQKEAGEFLRSRRARLTPEQLGIISVGRRRVPGLRREEVAMLAGTSSEYYARMERGDLAGVSSEVLDAVARVLRLDEAEAQHLHDLARTAAPGSARRSTSARRPPPNGVRPSLQAFLDAMTGAPAWLMNAQRDILATNTLGRALMAPLLEDPANGGNNARFIFLSPASRRFYTDWESAADSTVASLRTAAGRNPHDKGLTNLIGELVTRSDTFRIRWSAHNVRLHRAGAKQIVHPDVGELEFVYEGVEVPDHPGWMIFAYTVEAGSPSEERLRLLGSLAVSSKQAPAPTSTSGGLHGN